MDIKEMMIDENATMIEAMKQLDIVAKKVLFVVRNDVFVASLTDGDIRRHILKNGSLEGKIKDFANYSPKYFNINDKKKASKFLKQNEINAIPLVDNENKIVSIVFSYDDRLKIKNKLNIPVVIMAGGLGTRLYPYTKILPKPLIPIGEIPIAEHIINRFNLAGCNEFNLIVNHKKNMIKAYFNEIEKDYKVNYVDEDKPLGTGGGLSLLKGKIDSTFILSNCDILIEEDYDKIYSYHKEQGNLITMVCSLKKIKIPYGVIEIGEQGEIANMKEKPEVTFFTNTGMYIVEPRIIEELEMDKDIGFPDIIEHYKNLGEKIGVYPISEENWLDMGQLDELEEMRRRLGNE